MRIGKPQVSKEADLSVLRAVVGLRQIESLDVKPEILRKPLWRLRQLESWKLKVARELIGIFAIRAIEIESHAPECQPLWVRREPGGQHGIGRFLREKDVAIDDHGPAVDVVL